MMKMMIVRTALAFSLLLASTATAQTFGPRVAAPAAPLCSANPAANRSSCPAPAAAVLCSGHGSAAAGRCACFAGWTGGSCQTPAPGGLACSGHGDMIQGQCVCSTYWMGPDCSTAGLTISGRFFRQ
jgi:hypothetical protein